MHARLVLLAVVCFSFVVVASTAGAADVPAKLETTIKLGGKPSRVQVLVEAEGTVLLVDGQRQPLPVREPASVSAEPLALAKGQSAAVIRVTGASGVPVGALVVRGRRGAEVVFIGALEPRGDVGERTWSKIEARDLGTGAQAVVSQYQDRTAVCGGEPAAVAASAFDPQAGKLVPIPAAVPFAKREVVEVAATLASPGPQGAPKLPALRVAAASSVRDAELPWLASPLTALTDNDPKTHWSTALDRAPLHAFATLSVDAAGREVRAFSIVAKPPGVAAATPRTLWLVPDAGPVLHVTLAEPIAEGQAQWVALAQPRAMRCVSVVIDQVSGLDAGKPGSAALSDVTAYTDLDFGNGVDRLIAEVAAGGAPAARAVDVLRRVGPSVVAPLVAALPSLAPGARARAVRVWSAYLAEPAARGAVQAALDDPDARVRELSYEALAQGDADARGVLTARIRAGGLGAEPAAAALARTAPNEATSAVLSALTTDGATERAELRDALATACEQLKAACVDAVREWLRTAQPSVSARASVALAVAGQAAVPGAPQLAAELIAGASGDADEFEDRWRLVNAAMTAAANPDVDAWLAQLAVKEERWMLRATALSALSQRKAPVSGAVAKKALKDEYPRVRLVAVQGLVADASATAELTAHAQRDRWPMVRAAAYEALAKHTGTGSTLQGGVEDRAKSVRAAALRGLTSARVATAWPAVEKVLRNDNEWAEVTIEAAAYARALCIQAAREPLVALLVRALKPDAAAFEAEVGGPVFEALVELGGDAASDAQRIAARPTSPPGLKAMAKQAAARRPACASPAPAPAPAM